MECCARSFEFLSTTMARSLEAILDMSHLAGRTHFDPSLLPPMHHLNLHVNGDEFMNLIQHQQILGAKLDEIAREIHELFLREELAKKDDSGKPIYRIGSTGLFDGATSFIPGQEWRVDEVAQSLIASGK